MAATGFLAAGGRSVSNDRITREYRVESATDEADVTAFVATLPQTLAGLPFADFSAVELEEIQGSYDLTVNWGASQSSNGWQSENSTEYRFAFSAQSAHIYQSLQTIAGYRNPSIYTAAGTAPLNGAPNHHGAINVVNDGGHKRVEGIQLPTPSEVFKLSYVAGNSIITGAYQSLVESLCGKVNSTTFRGKPAGSIMLVRVDGGRNSAGIWNIEFGFGNVLNRTNIPVGSAITVAAKDGFDLLWVYYTTGNDAAAKSSIKEPAAAYVERVYERADLNLLNLPT